MDTKVSTHFMETQTSYYFSLGGKVCLSKEQCMNKILGLSVGYRQHTLTYVFSCPMLEHTGLNGYTKVPSHFMESPILLACRNNILSVDPADALDDILQAYIQTGLVPPKVG